MVRLAIALLSVLFVTSANAQSIIPCQLLCWHPAGGAVCLMELSTPLEINNFNNHSGLAAHKDIVLYSLDSPPPAGMSCPTLNLTFFGTTITQQRIPIHGMLQGTIVGFGYKNAPPGEKVLANVAVTTPIPANPIFFPNSSAFP